MVRESVRLGQIAGVRLAAHWSLIAVVAIVAVGLDRGILPDVAPGMAGGWYVTAAVATSLAFVATIVAHEFGHAMIARRQGLPVESVVVWALGGITSIDGEPATPAAELALSGIGPMVSLLLGAVLVGFGMAARAAGGPPLLAGSLAWLGGLNILLAVFNALPASPLDGGRMFHALLWRMTRSRARATAATTRIGQVVGLGTIAGGLYLMAAVGSVEGLWIAVTGLFVVVGASSERRQAVLVASIGDRRVAGLMLPLAPEPVPGWWDVSSVLAHAASAPPWLVAAVGDWEGRTSGIVAFAQIAAVPSRMRASTRVRDLAVPVEAVVVSGPDEPVIDLLRRWPTDAAWGVAVLGGRALGAISVGDLNALVAGAGRAYRRPRLCAAEDQVRASPAA